MDKMRYKCYVYNIDTRADLREEHFATVKLLTAAIRRINHHTRTTRERATLLPARDRVMRPRWIG